MKIFLNFKQPQALSYIWIQKLFQRLVWIKYQKKKKTYLLKTLEMSNYSKIPPIFTNICTLSFSIRPKTRRFSGQIFGFGLKWKTYFRSFTSAVGSLRIRLKMITSNNTGLFLIGLIIWVIFEAVWTNYKPPLAVCNTQTVRLSFNLTLYLPAKKVTLKTLWGQNQPLCT